MTHLLKEIVPDRNKVKPRSSGITMMLDHCQGLVGTEDLINMAGEYLDQIKLSFGTSILVSESFLRSKIDLVIDNGIDIYPGGTLMEVAYQQQNDIEYINWVKNCGFSMIEISNGIYSVSRKKRDDTIKRSKDAGLKVITEVGGKDSEVEMPISQICEDIIVDLDHGVEKVIIEGRESGKNIGVYDNEGNIMDKKVDAILDGINHRQTAIIWEAPHQHQQASFIQRFGSNVNLGNILPRDILGLEALRQGLRYETLVHFASENKLKNE